MRRIATALVATTALALTVTAAAQKQTIKVATDSVAVYVTVTDSDKRLVPDLVQEDFEILDNMKPVAINVFENKPVPITTVVMIDTSGSITAYLDFIKQGAEQFLLRLLPDDKAQVGEFSDKIKFHPGTFIDDRDRLIYLLKNELDFGYPTRLYDAAQESIERLLTADGRKVVILFTDGDDTASRRSFGDVLTKARDKEVMVYAIGLQSEFFNGARVTRSRPASALRKLADETGGGYFELKKTAELAPTFTRVMQELHSLYALGFSPTNLDGKEHKLEVRVKSGTTRARRTYIASRERLSSTN